MTEAPIDEKPIKRIFIPNLPADCTVEELRELAVPCGRIADCKLLPKVPNADVRRGFVVFMEPDDAAYAKYRLHGKFYRNRELVVYLSDPQPQPDAGKGQLQQQRRRTAEIEKPKRAKKQAASLRFLTPRVQGTAPPPVVPPISTNTNINANFGYGMPHPGSIQGLPVHPSNPFPPLDAVPTGDDAGEVVVDEFDQDYQGFQYEPPAELDYGNQYSYANMEGHYGEEQDYDQGNDETYQEVIEPPKPKATQKQYVPIQQHQNQQHQQHQNQQHQQHQSQQHQSQQHQNQQHQSQQHQNQQHQQHQNQPQFHQQHQQHQNQQHQQHQSQQHQAQQHQQHQSQQNQQHQSQQHQPIQNQQHQSDQILHQQKGQQQHQQEERKSQNQPQEQGKNKKQKEKQQKQQQQQQQSQPQQQQNQIQPNQPQTQGKNKKQKEKQQNQQNPPQIQQKHQQSPPPPPVQEEYLITIVLLSNQSQPINAFKITTEQYPNFLSAINPYLPQNTY